MDIFQIPRGNGAKSNEGKDGILTNDRQRQHRRVEEDIGTRNVESFSVPLEEIIVQQQQQQQHSPPAVAADGIALIASAAAAAAAGSSGETTPPHHLVAYGDVQQQEEEQVPMGHHLRLPARMPAAYHSSSSAAPGMVAAGAELLPLARVPSNQEMVITEFHALACPFNLYFFLTCYTSLFPWVLGEANLRWGNHHPSDRGPPSAASSSAAATAAAASSRASTFPGGYSVRGHSLALSVAPGWA